MGTLKPHSNRPLYSNTVIGTLAVDGWAVTFVTAKGAFPLLTVPNVTAHPSVATVPTSCYSMWLYILWILFLSPTCYIFTALHYYTLVRPSAFKLTALNKFWSVSVCNKSVITRTV